ncbi:MAG TPA: electron transfer flavoprotein subunit alpha/FixB family protein, partial [Thermogutta sp.]|nr:electron transfer flavoprotein subunit alpha/FixB family protein [Thermogutta sp.]
EKVEIDESLLALRLIERHIEPRKVNLKSARVIVAGGGGVGSKEDFRLIYELAGVIGGAVGASRAAVDSGFIGKEHQIGQTGTTVRPALYIAAGISGAVQHRAGMEESAKIIAINTDPNAPIFSIAHYGIVGDLKKVIPMMIKALRERPK